jgi:ubiquinone/menaquinone biosynthesis C-methylase UbiE
LSHIHGGSHTFDDPGRRQWQNPEAILDGIGLKPGMTLADIGCGGGFFALPAARRAGKTGKVYGVDANPDSISGLREQAAAEGLNNLELTVGKAEDYLPGEHCADIIFFGIVLHDFDDPGKVLQNVRRMIKSGGRLYDLDWKKEEAPFGPPCHIRFGTDKAARLIEAAGFEVVATENSGLYHYLITAKPK